MKLSQKRRSAIYAAVHEEIVTLRIELIKQGLAPSIDVLIAQAGNRAADAAVKAAEKAGTP